MTAPDRQPRNAGILAAEIREAWLVACAAIQFPSDVTDTRGPVSPEVAEDPRVTVILDARHTAFEWALAELVGGDYDQAPGWVTRSLNNGIVPERAPAADPGPAS